MQIRYLDFGNNVTPKTGIIGAARHLGWPVNGYRISLPRTISDIETLNPFEKVILGIMRVTRHRDSASIASETCLEQDFVEGVLLRLRDKEFIDEQNRITDEGVNRLDQNYGGLELRTAWVYRELVSGKLLPFIYLPKGDNPPRWKKEPQYAKVLKSATINFGAPSPDEVLASMRETKRRVEGYGDKIHLPRVGQIDVSPNPERYLLDCPIVMRDSDGRWRIADPFGYGYSRELETIFLQEMSEDEGLQKWLVNWSNSLVVDGGDEARDVSVYSLSKSVRDSYPGLEQSLRIRRDGTRSIGQVYAAIEWALFYSCRINGFTDKVDELRFASDLDQVSMIKQAMASIGCNVIAFVPPVNKHDLTRYLSEIPEMKVVLPMSILQAADDSSHPLRSFCEKHPDFVERISRMKSRRDAPLHGGDNDRIVELDSPDNEYMMELVSTLLPGVVFVDGGHVSGTQTDNTAFKNVNFNAENSIMGEFGPAVPYLKMTRGARESLLSAERFWISFDGEENIQPFLNDCYAALQAILDAEIVSDRVSRPESKSFDPCSTALERCQRLDLGELPGGLLKAKRTFIQDALQGGGNHTLGPSLIVYLSLADESKLSFMQSVVPGFVQGICDLITLRGHGNGTIKKSREETGNYRIFVFEVIKGILVV